MTIKHHTSSFPKPLKPFGRLVLKRKEEKSHFQPTISLYIIKINLEIFTFQDIQIRYGSRFLWFCFEA